MNDDRLNALADDLCAVDGVQAVVLGGSRARGTHRPDSDYDVGIYYEGDLDLFALERLAAVWAENPTSIAAPGEWGPWVNGGAWLTVAGVTVDWILRDLRRVEEQCERARNGQFAFHTQAGHPLGFLDIAYAGEVATALVLRDDASILAALAASVTPYPDALRSAMLENLWQVDFLLDSAEKGAKARDVAYVTLCLTNAAMLLAHGGHALAGEWVTNEKGLVTRVAQLPIDSRGFGDSVSTVVERVGSNPADLHDSIARMRAVSRPS